MGCAACTREKTGKQPRHGGGESHCRRALACLLAGRGMAHCGGEAGRRQRGRERHDVVVLLRDRRVGTQVARPLVWSVESGRGKHGRGCEASGFGSRGVSRDAHSSWGWGGEGGIKLWLRNLLHACVCVGPSLAFSLLSLKRRARNLRPGEGVRMAPRRRARRRGMRGWQTGPGGRGEGCQT